MKQWMWIVRRNGIVVAALTEKSHSAEELKEALIEFSESGPIERVWRDSIVLGEPLT